MSKIVSKLIDIPIGIDLVVENFVVSASSEKGRREYLVDSVYVNVEHKGSQVLLTPVERSKKSLSLCGLYRANINNMMIGLIHGYKKVMEINGVGYRVSIVNDYRLLILSLGLSHELILKIPDDVMVECKKNIVIVSGVDKDKVGMFAARLFDLKRPEVYKGTGVNYQGRHISRKQGKRK